MRTPSRRERIAAQLADLKMPGALEALDEILAGVDGGGTTAAEAIERLLAAQIALRNSRRLQTAMRSSRLPAVKTLADFDFSFQPTVKREQIDSLHELGCVERRENVVSLGPPGSGKSYLARALGHQARQLGISTRYFRVSRLLDQLALARADGSYLKLVQRLANTWLLVLDDWGLASLSGQGRHDLLEVLDDRFARRRYHPRLPAPHRTLTRCRRRPHLRGRHPRPAAQQRPPHHPQGRFHEAAVRLNQGDPPHPQPHLIHPCPAPLPDYRSNPDGLARDRWTAWPGTTGQLRSERVDDFVGIGNWERSESGGRWSRWDRSHCGPSSAAAEMGARVLSALRPAVRHCTAIP